MKKIIVQVVTVIFLLAILTGTVSAASFGVTLTSNKAKVQPGQEIELTFGIKDIDLPGGLTYSIVGKLQYDDNIFEPVTLENLSGLNNWAIWGYNDEDGEGKGKITVLKPSSEVKDQEALKIKLKVKEGISDITTTVSIVDVTATPRETEEVVAATTPASIPVVISNDAGGDGPDESDNPNPSGDPSNPDNPDNPDDPNSSDNPNNSGNPNGGEGQDGSDNPGTSGNGSQGGNNGKDDTGYKSDKLPQLGVNKALVISIGVVLAIGIGSLVKYEKMK